MKALFLALSVSFFFACGVSAKEVAAPSFLNEGFYSKLKNTVPAPPALESDVQASDERELRAAQKSRTEAECAAAEREAEEVSLENFFGAELKDLAEPKRAELAVFFRTIDLESEYFVQRLKREYPRDRPFVYLKDVKLCTKQKQTNSYPSGHATLARLSALVLKDIFPERESALEARAEVLARHRVLAGAHHPSDIAVGKQIGESIYAELRKSKKFLTTVEKVKQRMALEAGAK